MADLTLRIPKQIFVEDLVEDMTRETWAILRRAAPPAAAPLGSFVSIRTALRQYLWSRIRGISSSTKGARVLTLNVAHDEPETLGMEAAAAIAVAQEPLFELLHSVTRVARLISAAIEAVVAPYRYHGPAVVAPAPTSTFRAARRAVLAREAAMQEVYVR